MKLIRIALGLLILLPAGLYLADLQNPTHPGHTNYLEIGYLLTGLPILLLNYLAWFMPEQLESITGALVKTSLASLQSVLFLGLLTVGMVGLFVFIVGMNRPPAADATPEPGLPSALPLDTVTPTRPAAEDTPLPSETPVIETTSPAKETSPIPLQTPQPLTSLTPQATSNQPGITPTASTTIETVVITPARTATGVAPKVFTGTGNAKLDVSAYTGPVLVAAEHAENSTFIVYALDANGDPYDSLFESPETYSGQRVLNGDGTLIPGLEIETTGNWKITIQPLSSAPLVAMPGAFEGQNARVVRLGGTLGDIVLQAGNAHSDYIIVIGYGDNGYTIWLIDEEIPDNNTYVIDDPAIKYLEIIALGPWRMEIKP